MGKEENAVTWSMEKPRDLSSLRPPTPKGWRWSSGSEEGTKAKKIDGKGGGRRRGRKARQCRRSRRQRSSTSVRPSLLSSPLLCGRPAFHSLLRDQFPDPSHSYWSISWDPKVCSQSQRPYLMIHVRFCFWW